MQSKYPESAEAKISLGPVFAVNPRYVKYVRLVATHAPDWVEVTLITGRTMTTELETTEACKELIAEFVAANPKIAVLA